MKNSILSLTIACLTSTPIYADNLSILVDAKNIEKKTNESFYDDSISIDTDANGNLDSTLHFSYSKAGPTPTCTELEECKIKNNPVLTAYIDFPNKRVHINFMCSSIGFFSEKTNGLRDMYCGPELRLHWNGKNYTEQ